MKPAQNKPTLSDHDEIAALAHLIYEAEGRPEGLAEEHWARAERNLREQRLAMDASQDKQRASGE